MDYILCKLNGKGLCTLILHIFLVLIFMSLTSCNSSEEVSIYSFDSYWKFEYLEDGSGKKNANSYNYSELPKVSFSSENSMLLYFNGELNRFIINENTDGDYDILGEELHMTGRINGKKLVIKKEGEDGLSIVFTLSKERPLFPDEEIKEAENIVGNILGVSNKTEEVEIQSGQKKTITGCLVEAEFTNKRDDSFGMGHAYVLETIKDGEWYSLDTKVETAFTEDLMIVESNGTWTEKFDLWPYGELEPGEYRIIRYEDSLTGKCNAFSINFKIDESGNYSW